MKLIKNKKLSLLLQILLFVVIFIAILSWQQKDMLANDEPIESFTLKDLTDQPHTLFHNAGDKKTLLYFFAPWCSICRISMPSLNTLDKEKTNIYVIALSYDSKEQVQSFMQDIDYQGSVLLGNPQIAKRFKVSAFPSYYVLNSEHKVIHKGLGLSSSIALWWHTL